MAGPGGKVVGRVSIKGVPDTSDLRSDLKKQLRSIEASVVLTVPASIDLRDAERDVSRFQRKWNGSEVAVNVDLDHGAASAQLALFSNRPRTVPLNVEITKTSLTKAATAIAALSGARVVTDLVKNFGDRLANLDRALPKIAAVTLSIAALSAVLLNSVAGITTVAAGIASLSGLLLVLPGIAAGAGMGITTMAVALADAKSRLEVLGPSFTRLRTIISDNFWERAQKPIISFVRSVMPDLRDGLRGTSQALGSWTASVVTSFKEAFSGGALDGMFADLSNSIKIAAGGSDGFAASITTLGQIGASYLPRLAKWVSDITVGFNDWLTEAEATGQVTVWIESAIKAAQQLGSILSSTGSILHG